MMKRTECYRCGASFGPLLETDAQCRAYLAQSIKNDTHPKAFCDLVVARKKVTA